MHAVFGGQFRHCALALYGFQRHASLEPRVMVPAFLHILISSFLETGRRQMSTFTAVARKLVTIANALCENCQKWAATMA